MADTNIKNLYRSIVALGHFANVGKMVAIGSGAGREIDDIRLSRYACIVRRG